MALPRAGQNLSAFATFTPKQGQWRPCLSGRTEHWLGSASWSPMTLTTCTNTCRKGQGHAVSTQGLGAK